MTVCSLALTFHVCLWYFLRHFYLSANTYTEGLGMLTRIGVETLMLTLLVGCLVEVFALYLNQAVRHICSKASFQRNLLLAIFGRIV